MFYFSFNQKVSPKKYKIRPSTHLRCIGESSPCVFVFWQRGDSPADRYRNLLVAVPIELKFSSSPVCEKSIDGSDLLLMNGSSHTWIEIPFRSMNGQHSYQLCLGFQLCHCYWLENCRGRKSFLSLVIDCIMLYSTKVLYFALLG